MIYPLNLSFFFVNIPLNIWEYLKLAEQLIKSEVLMTTTYHLLQWLSQSRARRSLWAGLAGREKELLVTHVNDFAKIMQKHSHVVWVKLPIIMIWRAVL